MSTKTIKTKTFNLKEFNIEKILYFINDYNIDYLEHRYYFDLKYISNLDIEWYIKSINDYWSEFAKKVTFKIKKVTSKWFSKPVEYLELDYKLF